MDHSHGSCCSYSSRAAPEWASVSSTDQSTRSPAGLPTSNTLYHPPRFACFGNLQGGKHGSHDGGRNFLYKFDPGRNHLAHRGDASLVATAQLRSTADPADGHTQTHPISRLGYTGAGRSVRIRRYYWLAGDISNVCGIDIQVLALILHHAGLNFVCLHEMINCCPQLIMIHYYLASPQSTAHSPIVSMESPPFLFLQSLNPWRR